jgi:tRNA (mo5U34)-methyltransferase
MEDHLGEASTPSDRRIVGPMDAQALRNEIVQLAPWHMDVELNSTLTTGAWRDEGITAEQAALRVSFIQPRDKWRRLLLALYPNGLEGRTFLDCACNCGGYSFWCRELGGGGGLGFDVRERWIEQAKFLQSNRAAPSDSIQFEVCDVYDLASITDAEYDISLFKGLFYHLPDPIHALKIVADRTRELIIVNTAARTGLADGALVAERESVTMPMSGVHGLAWLPTGPGVIRDLLVWLGFAACRTTFWHQAVRYAPAGWGRFEVIAARDEALFENYDRVTQDGAHQQP